MRLTVVDDIDSGKVLASREFNHGDFPFRFMIRIEYSDYHSEELAKQVGKYIVNLNVVSVEAAKTTDSYESALGSCGWTAEEVQGWGSMAEYQMLLEHGTAAHLWESSGNNLKALMKQCRKELKQADFLFGFAMDRAENAIGTTGWDAIKGDILAPLRRHSEEPNVQLMRKLSEPHTVSAPDNDGEAWEQLQQERNK